MCSVLAHRKAFKGPVRLRGAFSVSEGGGWAPGGVGGCSGRARSAVSLCRGAAVSAGRRRLLWGPRAAERRPLTVPGASPISTAPGRARQWGGQGAGHVAARRAVARVSWRPRAAASAALPRGRSCRREKPLTLRALAAAAAAAARAVPAQPRCPPAPSKGGAEEGGRAALPLGQPARGLARAGAWRWRSPESREASPARGQLRGCLLCAVRPCGPAPRSERFGAGVQPCLPPSLWGDGQREDSSEVPVCSSPMCSHWSSPVFGFLTEAMLCFAFPPPNSHFYSACFLTSFKYVQRMKPCSTVFNTEHNVSYCWIN